MIEAKKKICVFCNTLQYLWRSNPATCKSCNNKSNFKPIVATKKKFAAIAPFSAKQLQELKLYRIERDEYLHENPVCMAKIPGICRRSPTELHHAKGRGIYLRIQLYWRAFCHDCHMHVQEKMPMDQAVEKGFMVYRNGKN